MQYNLMGRCKEWLSKRSPQYTKSTFACRNNFLAILSSNNWKSTFL